MYVLSSYYSTFALLHKGNSRQYSRNSILPCNAILTFCNLLTNEKLPFNTFLCKKKMFSKNLNVHLTIFSQKKKYMLCTYFKSLPFETPL